MFSAVGQPVPFNNSISGPRDCLCSEQYACTAGEDNHIDSIFGVMEVNNVLHISIFITFCNMYLGGRLSSSVFGPFRLSNVHLVRANHKKVYYDFTEFFNLFSNCFQRFL